MTKVNLDALQSIDRSLCDAASLFDEDITLEERHSILSTVLACLDHHELASLLESLSQLTTALADHLPGGHYRG